NRSAWQPLADKTGGEIEVIVLQEDNGMRAVSAIAGATIGSGGSIRLRLVDDSSGNRGVDGAVAMFPGVILRLSKAGPGGGIPEIVLKKPEQLIADLVVVERIDLGRQADVTHLNQLAPKPNLARDDAPLWGLGEGEMVARGHCCSDPGEGQAAG